MCILLISDDTLLKLSGRWKGGWWLLCGPKHVCVSCPSEGPCPGSGCLKRTHGKQLRVLKQFPFLKFSQSSREVTAVEPT